MPAEIRRRHVEAEQLAFLEVLIADRRRQVGPRRAIGIRGRLHRVEPDVAEPARHADQIRRLDRSIRQVRLQIPLRRVEGRVVEPPQADDAGRQTGNAGNRFGRGTIVHPEAVAIGRARRLAAWMVDDAEPFEASGVVPGVDVRQQIDVAGRRDRHPAPELLVAGGPEVPGVATELLVGGQRVALVFVRVSGRLGSLVRQVRPNRPHQRCSEHAGAERGSHHRLTRVCAAATSLAGGSAPFRKSFSANT